MVRRGDAAIVFLCVASLSGWGCGKDPGEPSIPRVGAAPAPTADPLPDHVPREPSRVLAPKLLPPEPLRVGGEVIEPIEISRVEPDCGQLHGAEHPAVVELIVSETGLVRAARVLRTGTPATKPAILAAVRQWRFRPATFNGKPVEVYLTVTTRGCP